MLDSVENFLPVYCDKQPNELVTYYSTKSKQMISKLALIQEPDMIESAVPINKLYIKHFFRTAKPALLELN